MKNTLLIALLALSSTSFANGDDDGFKCYNETYHSIFTEHSVYLKCKSDVEKGLIKKDKIDSCSEKAHRDARIGAEKKCFPLE